MRQCPSHTWFVEATHLSFIHHGERSYYLLAHCSGKRERDIAEVTVKGDNVQKGRCQVQ